MQVSRKTQNIIKYLCIGSILFFVGLGMARSGDIFLRWIGKKIHIKIDYKNHSGFISCFILKFIELDKPVFALRDLDVAVGCQSAFIEPHFDEFLEKKAIILDFTLKDALFLSVEEKIADLNPLLKSLENLRFDNMHVRLRVYGETVEFVSFEAYMKDVKLHASGYARESGDFDISAKIFFSPEMAAKLPEELGIFLEGTPEEWQRYYLHVDSEGAKPSFKLETDKFKLDFEHVQSQ